MQLNIEFQDIKIEDKVIIHSSNLSMEGGKAYCIIGENGAGKTTLLNYIATSEHLKIMINNKFVTRNIFQKRIAYVPNDPPFFSILTGIENIQYIMSLWKIKNKNEFLSKFKHYCTQFNLSNNQLNQPLYSYSLGMKYKLFFIAMCSREIDILILDEPFTSLDKVSQEQVLQLLEKFVIKNKILIYVTHIQEFKDRLSDSIIEVKDKRLFHKKGD